jgi:hypothetical protein
VLFFSGGCAAFKWKVGPDLPFLGLVAEWPPFSETFLREKVLLR